MGFKLQFIIVNFVGARNILRRNQMMAHRIDSEIGAELSQGSIGFVMEYSNGKF